MGEREWTGVGGWEWALCGFGGGLAVDFPDGDAGEVLAVSGGALGVFAAAEFEDAQLFPAGVGVYDGGDAGVFNQRRADGDGAVRELGKVDFVKDGLLAFVDGEAVQQDGVARADAKLLAADGNGGGDVRFLRLGGFGGHWRKGLGFGRGGENSERELYAVLGRECKFLFRPLFCRPPIVIPEFSSRAGAMLNVREGCSRAG